jgi:chromosome segregation protein
MYSKKTVTCANSIYGVRMRESGVSKQGSVRFEDIGNDGRLVDDKDTQAA